MKGAFFFLTIAPREFVGCCPIPCVNAPRHRRLSFWDVIGPMHPVILEEPMKRKSRKKIQLQRLKKAAKKAPRWVHVVAAGIRPTRAELEEYKARRAGLLRPPSFCWRIDPASYVPQPTKKGRQI